MPEIPSPKELLKKAAEFHDTMFEIATKPIKDMAESLGLPTPPEPPKAQDIVESLPELPFPTPEAFIPTKKETEVVGEVGKGEVAKIKEAEVRKPKEVIKFKVV